MVRKVQTTLQKDILSKVLIVKDPQGKVVMVKTLPDKNEQKQVQYYALYFEQLKK